MASLRPVTTVFQDARNSIEQEINRIVIGLNNAKAKMFAKIEQLEKEFADKQKQQQQQQQHDLEELTALKTQTEGLKQNNFKGLQTNVLREINKGIKQLNFEIEKSRIPEYQINVNWGMCVATLLSQITESKLDISPKKKIESKVDISPKKEIRHPQPNPQALFFLYPPLPNPTTNS